MTQTVQKASTSIALNAGSNSTNLTLTATVTTSAGSPTGAVSFMDGTTQLGNSAVNGSGVAAFSTTALTAGTNSLTATYSGDGNFNISTSTAVSVVATFTISATGLSPSSISAGQSAASTVTITPSNGFNPSGVTLTCAVTPAANPAPTCSAGTISVANDTVTATVTVKAPASMAALPRSVGAHPAGMLIAFGLLPALLLGTGGMGKDQRRRLLSFGVVLLVLGGCAFQVACGGSSSGTNGNGGPKPTLYTVTVTASANGTQHTATSTLTVQ